MPRSRWPTQNEFSNIFGGSLSPNVESEHFFNLCMYKFWLPILCFHGIFVYVNTCLCILLYFFIRSFPPFVLCYPDLRLSSLIVFYWFFLYTCLFSTKRQKGYGSRWEERRELADEGGSKTVIWIYCMKAFSILEINPKMSVHTCQCTQ